jgi:uncharacterized protein GlcG (DUF336 family)
MDGALLGTIDVAQRKVRTAALFQTDSRLAISLASGVLENGPEQ